MARHRIADVVPDDVRLFELGVAVEVFARARPELEREWYDVRVCSANAGPAKVMGGLFGVAIPYGVEAIDEADTVIVPQAGSLDCPAEPVVIDAIRRAYARGARLISFCSGAFVLAAAGVLDGRPAATHWKFARRLATEYPRVRVRPHVLYVDDGQVLTSAGTAAAIDLSLHVIRQDHGAGVARHIARSMVVAPHREGDQAQFILAPALHLKPQQDVVARTMEYALSRLDQDLSIPEIAAVAFMSPRNYSRRFRQRTGTTPAQWILQQRLTRARRLLEESDIPIEQIAAETGFGSPVTFRQRFSDSQHMSPSAYRKAFRADVERAAS